MFTITVLSARKIWRPGCQLGTKSLVSAAIRETTVLFVLKVYKLVKPHICSTMEFMNKSNFIAHIEKYNLLARHLKVIIFLALSALCILLFFFFGYN